MSAAEANPLLENMVSMEMAGMVQEWFVAGGAVHILLREPSSRCGCGERHFWFVNRDGCTRCVACDDDYLAVLAGRAVSLATREAIT